MAFNPHSAICAGRRHAVIALGSNENSAWGSPERTLGVAIERLRLAGVRVTSASNLFITRAVGGGRQPPFCNAVISVELTMGAASLLRLLKSLERAAGRRLGRHWGPRPLDLDILDAGCIVGRPSGGRRPAGRLILPHPEMHRRAFVLVPLAQVAPHWWHPVLHQSVQRLARSRFVTLQMPHVVVRARDASA